MVQATTTPSRTPSEEYLVQRRALLNEMNANHTAVDEAARQVQSGLESLLVERTSPVNTLRNEQVVRLSTLLARLAGKQKSEFENSASNDRKKLVSRRIAEVASEIGGSPECTCTLSFQEVNDLLMPLLNYDKNCLVEESDFEVASVLLCKERSAESSRFEAAAVERKRFDTRIDVLDGTNYAIQVRSGKGDQEDNLFSFSMKSPSARFSEQLAGETDGQKLHKLWLAQGIKHAEMELNLPTVGDWPIWDPRHSAFRFKRPEER